jgi:hypothetical protein
MRGGERRVGEAAQRGGLPVAGRPESVRGWDCAWLGLPEVSPWTSSGRPCPPILADQWQPRTTLFDSLSAAAPSAVGSREAFRNRSSIWRVAGPEVEWRAFEARPGS